MLGRLLGTFILTRVRANRLLAVAGFCASALVVLSMNTTGWTAILALVGCGFFNSVMFPSIFALGLARLGPLTSRGSGLMMTMVVGGAVIPWLLGAIADRIGIQHAFVLPLLCYLYVAFYGLVGSHVARDFAV